MDLGSDGNAGFHGLERKLKLNVDAFNDQSHGINCDWNQMLVDNRCRSLMVLNCVRWNLPHGPRKGENLRAHQFKGCLSKAYAKLPSQLPLLGPHVTAILRSIEQMGHQLPGLHDPEVEVLEWLKDNATFRTHGRRTHLCRFCAGPHALVRGNKSWGIDEFEITHCALEFDWLGSRKLAEHLDKRAKVAADKSEDAPLAAPGPDEHLIRPVSRNAPVVAFQMTCSERLMIWIGKFLE